MVILFVLAVLRVAAFCAGVLIVVSTLLSAIRTVVLPRAQPVQLTRVVFLGIRYLFDLRTRKSATYEERDAVMALYAPLSLLALPGAWLVLVATGYTCMYWALGAAPASTAFALSGSSLFTLGFASAADLPKTVLEFSEAAIGLLLAALLVSYLPTMYAIFARRETAVTMLEVRAGTPPSAVQLFTRYQRLQRMDKLNDLWVAWEVWFAEIEESHTSFPALTFFRSPQPDHSWITAAGAVLDSAALAVTTIDIPHDVQADLCIRAGYLALRRISAYFAIPYNPAPSAGDAISISREEYDAACDELAAAGVALKADREAAWRAFAGWRVNYDIVLLALAGLTMAPYAPWSSDRSLARARPRLFPRWRSVLWPGRRSSV
jgi:hypothetical protein